jgi:hypothetical protein
MQNHPRIAFRTPFSRPITGVAKMSWRDAGRRPGGRVAASWLRKAPGSGVVIALELIRGVPTRQRRR